MDSIPGDDSAHPSLLVPNFYKVAVQVCKGHPSNKWAIYSKEAEYQRVHDSKFLDVLFEPLPIAFLFRCLELKGSSTMQHRTG